MNFYQKEIEVLKKSGRFRERRLYNPKLCDFATNDYLGLAHKKELHDKTAMLLLQQSIHAPKASLLVGGYHEIHKNFEELLCRVNGFEDGVVVGSGFNANIALIEALIRRDDLLIMDEAYHASGMLASNVGSIQKELFLHNDMNHLEELLQKHQNKKRRIVAVEGIYSMDGDIVPKEVFELCRRYEAILIVDEAHSSGVVGENLMGVYDYYNIAIEPNHIKMGTLGKAYGSFGAYILASSHIISYLLNRAKPLIYATALSLYDTLLAHISLEYILEQKAFLKKEIAKRQKMAQELLGISVDGLIVPVVVGSNTKVLELQRELEAKGYFVGAIRTPTVKHAILRLIARVSQDDCSFEELLKVVKAMEL